MATKGEKVIDATNWRVKLGDLLQEVCKQDIISAIPVFGTLGPEPAHGPLTRDEDLVLGRITQDIEQMWDSVTAKENANH